MGLNTSPGHPNGYLALVSSTWGTYRRVARDIAHSGRTFQAAAVRLATQRLAPSRGEQPVRLCDCGALGNGWILLYTHAPFHEAGCHCKCIKKPLFHAQIWGWWGNVDRSFHTPRLAMSHPAFTPNNSSLLIGAPPAGAFSRCGFCTIPRRWLDETWRGSLLVSRGDSKYRNETGNREMAKSWLWARSGYVSKQNSRRWQGVSFVGLSV